MNITETNVQVLPLKDLHENKGQIEGVPANPRILRDDKYKALLRSLQEDDLTGVQPLKVYNHNGQFIVLGGNMRLKALRELKRDASVSCLVVPQDTPTDILRKIVIIDNSTFGEWDFDMLANEWSADELNDWGVSVPEIETQDNEPTAQEDDFDEEKDKVETVCKKGDIWLLGQHRLMCGDSTNAEEVERLMDGETADLWLTDPPYNVNYSAKDAAVLGALGYGCDHKDIANDNLSDEEFDKFLYSAFYAAKSVLKAGGAFYVWHAQGHTSIAFILALDKVGLPYKQQIIWNKNEQILGRQDYHWKHEPCLYGWKPGAGHYFINVRNENTVIPDAEELKIDKMKAAEMRELLHKIFDNEDPVSVIDERRVLKGTLHPTMKPVKLFGRLVRNSSRKGEIVLDTFGGSGTTIVACEQLGRKCYMMELDPHYCDVIIARWEKLTGQKATKIK